MLPLLPATQSDLSTVKLRTFVCEPSGRPAIILLQSGLSLIPVHHTQIPNGTSLSSFVILSATIMLPRFTWTTRELRMVLMPFLWNLCVAYSASLRSYVLSMWSWSSTICTLAHLASAGGNVFAMSFWIKSSNSAASSTPEGPPPTITNVSTSRILFSLVPGSTALSNLRFTVLLRLFASSISLRKRQFSSTPGTLKVFGTAPTPTTR
mmetsp:Transcript_11476/g.70558  ORF Transcript_11476/g.70558 Transcript_11476/m.70558 type:complete len:208 (-) Transcript_11476:604-1227(-)